MSSHSKQTSPSTSPRATLRMAVVLLLAAFGMVGTATAAGCGTDTELGTYAGGESDKGVKWPANGDGALVCKTKDGDFYVTDPKNTYVYRPSGGTIRFVKGTTRGEILLAPLGPAALPFEFAIIDLLTTERASLSGLTPFAGLLVYALELSDSLKLLGDNSEIWSDASGIPRLLTDGVFGFEQSGNTLSMIASTTADGMTPVRYDFNPGTLGLDFELAGGIAGSNVLMRFTNGSLFPATQDGISFLLTANAVSEPGSLPLAFFALTALLAVRRARR